MGLDTLMETISTLAEVKELRARKEGMAEGYVIESRVDKGKGYAYSGFIQRCRMPKRCILLAR